MTRSCSPKQAPVTQFSGFRPTAKAKAKATTATTMTPFGQSQMKMKMKRFGHK